MKTMIKRITAIIVFTLAAAIILTACASNSGNNNSQNSNQTVNQDNTGDNTAETTEAALTPEAIFAGLDMQKYSGKQFNLIARETMLKDFFSEAENGDVINDAVFKRNQMVEDTFDVKINVITNAGTDWGKQESVIKKSVMAGDGAYDLVDNYAAFVGNLVSNKIYLNLLDIPHLRLTEAWWSQHTVDELTVNGKLYDVPGDLSLNLWESAMTVFFSKSMLQSFGLDDPYNLVRNGQWTLDKMIEMSRGVSADLNGDGKMDNQDRYGTFIYDDLAFNNFHNAFDIPTTLKDSSGIPYFNLQSPEVLDLAERMYNLATSTDGVTYGNKNDYFKTLYISPDYPVVAKSLDMFVNNQILFYPSILGDAEKLRSMETDFGILPYPKKTVEQEQYKTCSRDQHTMFGIPTDVKDADFAGLITEALCVASNKIVVPTYYDVALKSKFTRDDESAEMLDIIRQGLNFDFGIEFSAQIGQAGWVIRTCVNQNSFNFASTLEKSIGSYQKSLDKFLAKLEQ